MLQKRLALGPVLDLASFSSSRGDPTAVAVGSGTELWVCFSRHPHGSTLARFPGGQPVFLDLPWLNTRTRAIRVLGKDAFALGGEDGVTRVVDERGRHVQDLDARSVADMERAWNPWRVDGATLRDVAAGMDFKLPLDAHAATARGGQVLLRVPGPGHFVLGTLGRRRVQAVFTAVVTTTAEEPLGLAAAGDARAGAMVFLHGVRVFRLGVEDLAALS